jgi:predicted peptidase
MGLLLALLDRRLAGGAADCRRVYVTGISMGGYGTWDILCRRPGLFAAGLPICGGGDVAQAKTIARIPVWAFHGSADTAVPVCRSRAMMSALWKEGSNAHYREYPDAGHNVWTATYADKNVLGWFFRQRRR